MLKLPRPEYFEAKIQLRPRNKEIEDFIVQRIASRNDVAITKVEELKTGVDFYVTSQRYARALGKLLNSHFKGKLVITKQIFGRNRQSSRVLYRGTVLFRVDPPDEAQSL